jgi:S-adenosylmethionine uptake transporter
MKRIPLPFFLALGGVFVLCVMDAVIKSVGDGYSTTQLVFLRFASGSIWSLFAFGILRPGIPSMETATVNSFRGVIWLVTALGYFYSLQTLPLAEATAFSFLSPVFLVLFGILFLGEAVRHSTYLSIVLSFAGMLVMTFGGGSMTGSPIFSFSLHPLGVAAAIGSSITYALGIVLLRQRTQKDAIIHILLFQNLVPMLLLSIPAYLTWHSVPSIDIFYFLTIGALALLGQMMLAYAFKWAEASNLAPIEYTSLVIAAALGFVFFNEVPGVTTVLGSGFVIAGTLFSIRSSS